MSFDELRNYLKMQKVIFNTEHWPNKGCTSEVAWNIIRIGDYLSIFFARGKMFKNVCTVRLTKKAVFERENRILDGHKQTVKYIAGIAI